LITARDIAIPRPGKRPPQPGAHPRRAPAPVPHALPARVPPAAAALAMPFRERLLLIIIYITVLASSVAFIEPSPHDALMCVLAVTCLIAGVHFDRKLLALFFLLLLWNVGGILSLMNVPGREKNIQFVATSIYLALAAVMWACIFAENTMARLAAMRSAYILTAVIVAAAGIVGYLNVIPYAHKLFAPEGRALGFFKDPNVYGPFMIWPAMVLMERLLVHRLRLLDVLMLGILVVALLLAFSRGAWFHFAVSALVMAVLSFITKRRTNTRLRIIFVSAVTIGVLVAFLTILLSVPAIHKMFEVRAHLLQSYDVGQQGRFRLQELALGEMLTAPNGLGPFGFADTHINQQHNVYLQAFLVYGWIGGVSYILLVLTTIWVALRSVTASTPWQTYIVTALAAFAGEVAEGFIIDSDHWRHFFLLLGIIWALWAATSRYTRQQALRQAGGYLRTAI
jgi:O-antigen ligase